MAQLDYVARSLIRAEAFRALRRVPLWLALTIRAAGWVLERVR
jgi:hypothetical protein